MPHNQSKLTLRIKQISLFFLAITAWPALALPIQTVTKDDLPKFKKQSCTLIHLWASWCAPCVEELPNLLRSLPLIEKLNPIVIDVSTPHVQQRDSKPLLERIAPKFPVYFKSAGDDDAFLNAMDRKWSGALPYSVLFDRGRVIKKWEGPIDLATLKKAVAASCRDAKKPAGAR